MASDKFVDVSAAAGGDGTLITPWNDLIDLWVNGASVGTLNAGDVVHIRTADSGGSLSCSTDGAARTMLEFGTISDPITWQFDAGVKWAESGVFTINTTDGNYLKFSLFNKWVGTNKNGRFLWDYTSSYTYWLYLKKQNLFIDIEFEFGTTNGKVPYIGQGTYGSTIFVNCLLDMKGAVGSSSIFKPANYAVSMVWLGMVIDCNGLSAGTGQIINQQSLGARHYVSGGGFTNVGAIVPKLFTATLSTNYYTTICEVSGFDFSGKSISDVSVATGQKAWIGAMSFVDNSPLFNFFTFNASGQTCWESGKGFPTLNATLPDLTPWSIQCRNGNVTNCHMTLPFTDNTIRVNSPTAGAKKITVEFLVADQIASKTDRDFFLEVMFYDDTGEIRWQSTRSNISPAALTSSTAAWSTTTFGGKTFSKYKIECTLKANVAENEVISVQFGSGVTQVATDDWYFVCPAILVEDV